MRKLTLLFLLAFIATPILSQKYLVDIQVISVEDGLPTRDVFDIEQDKKGFIWFSTRGAINRYDGKRVRTYTADFLRTLDRNPLDIAIDQLDRVWYCEWFGLSNENFSGIIDIQNDSIITFESLTNGLFTSKDVLDISQTKDNTKNILISTRSGKVYKYDGKTFALIFQTPRTTPSQPLFCDAAPDGSFWVMSGPEVLKIKDRVVVEKYKFPEDRLFAFQVIPHPSELIVELGFDHKVSQYWKNENGVFRPFIIPKDTTQNESIIKAEHKDIFYLNTQKDLLIKDFLGKTLFQFKNIEGRELFQDTSGIFWLASQIGMIKISVKENPFTTLQKGGNIRGIYKDEKMLCIGDYLGNYFKNLDTDKDYNPTTTPTKTIFYISKDKNGHLWAGSIGKEIWEFNPLEKKWMAHKFRKLENPHVIFKNEATGNLLVGSDGGLAKINLQAQTLSPIELPGASRKISVRFFYENEAGIWLATSKGLYLLDPKTEQLIQRFAREDGLPNDNLNHLYEDAEGIFWIASKGGGLIRWDRQKNSFRQFTQEDGLFYNTLYAVYEDDFDNLWLPSNYGLMRFDKADYDTQVYLPKNGLPHEEFNTFSHFQAADGTLFFGGLGGVTQFHPKDLLQKSNTETPLLITSMRILSERESDFKDYTKKFQTEKQIVLKPDDQVVELDLAILDYESSEQNQFVYQISGHQERWIYTKNAKLSLAKPAYGKFQLNIKGRTPAGIWAKNMLSIPIVVEKPFYLKNWFFCFIGISCLGLVLGYFNYRVYRLNKSRQRLKMEVKKRTVQIEKDKATILAQTVSLKELDKTKTRFFSNITHEFRTPLTLIIGPLKQMLTGKMNAVEMTDKLSKVTENAEHLLTLINQLLDFSKLEGGSMKLETTVDDIATYTQVIVNRFQAAAAKKQLNLHFKSALNEPKVTFDKDKWNKILYNLLSNAIKFTPDKGHIYVSLSMIQLAGEKQIYLFVKDTGIGIKKEHQEKIFDRFSQVDNSMTRTQEGTGIGLSLVKELVEFQQGKITIASELGKGTEFIVSIPLLEQVSTAITNFAIETIPPIPLARIVQTRWKNEDGVFESIEKLKILVVEDNPDICAYIRSCFEESAYEILTVADGKTGVEKALQTVPDLIISDIMMPKKNGYELLNDLKSNLVTSHIPIILLSAKASLDSRLEGLSGGVDAYLTKPFSAKELVLRVQKLIESRRRLQKRYAKGVLPTAIDDINRPEDEFITNLRTFIMENLENTNLNGDIIGQQFFISRGHLHRKIKALTGQSTSEYIRAIRLQTSIELLQEKKWQVSEIAYKVGFASTSHFSRTFKKQFGKSPTQV